MQVTPDELTALMVAVIDIERKRIVTANHITVTKTNAFIGDLQTDNARLRAALENVLNDLMYKDHSIVIDMARQVLDNPPSTLT